MNEKIRQRMKDLFVEGYHSMHKVSDEEMEACLDEIERMTKARVKNVMRILETGKR